VRGGELSVDRRLPNPQPRGSCASGGRADDQTGMNAVPPQPSRRGLGLLIQHCASLDPDTPTARDRLELVLGRELAQKLVFALSTAGSPDRQRFAA
jgi:hypothetical protein